MTEAGPAAPRVARTPRLPRTPSTPLFTALAALLALLTGCSLAGGPAGPSPGTGAGGEGGEDEVPYLDGSLDGSGDPAGLEELVLGEPLGSEGTEGVGGDGAVAGTAASFDEEIRAQFGTLFLDPAAAVPPAVTSQVAEYVELFHAGRARSNFERWLAREGRYREMILAELRAAGLPEGLLYLAMLESGFNPTAVSRARAVGLWQFMRATGRESGLRIDDWVDERRDPIASTRAAIGHLRVLHDALGDWALAAAAYNAGLGRVRRAQEGTGAGYFQLAAEGRLPRETRNYVPLILAAGHVARHRDRYGFGEVVAEPPHAFLPVEVDGRTRLTAVASVTGVPVDTLRALNAHLLRGAAPPGKRYAVRLPLGTPVADLGERLAALPLETRILPEYREVFVTVRSGDSWWRIARAHGRTVRAVRALNPKLGEVIHPGQRVLVDRQIVTDAQLAAASDGPAGRPAAAVSSASASASAEGGASSKTRESGASSPRAASPEPAPRRVSSAAAGDGLYRVRPGDTMSELAAELGVSVREMATWNDMPGPRPLRTGETVRVAPPATGASGASGASGGSGESESSGSAGSAGSAGTRVHEVVAGETMSGLARRYAVTVPQLAAWNGMQEPRPLRIGETLVVSAGAADPDTASTPVRGSDPLPAGWRRHRVERGETLTSVARRYGVGIDEIVSWNHLGAPRPLREGEVLVLPAEAAAPSTGGG